MHIALQSSIGTKINLWSSTMKVFEKTHNVVMNSFCSTSALQDIHEILKEFIGEKVIKCPWIFSSNEKLPLMRFWHAMTFEAILYATKVIRKFNVTNKRRTHFILISSQNTVWNTVVNQQCTTCHYQGIPHLSQVLKVLTFLLNTSASGWFWQFLQKKTAVFGCLTNNLAPPPIALESCSMAQTDRPI